MKQNNTSKSPKDQNDSEPKNYQNVNSFRSTLINNQSKNNDS